MIEQANETPHEVYPDPHHHIYSKTLFGFWLYLLTDFVLFGALFAAYVVLQGGGDQSTSGRQLFNLPLVFAQTLVLLLCSFTSGLAGVCAHRKQQRSTLIWFSLTFLLGLIFMAMEYRELSHLLRAGYSWQRSAFLSAFFTLIGTHAIHVLLALLWILVLLVPVMREGVTNVSIRRLTCLKMFWQFLNIVWIFIFTIIYLQG